MNNGLEQIKAYLSYGYTPFRKVKCCSSSVSDGVFVVVLGNGDNPQVKMTDFMSDEDLFGVSLPDDRIDCDLYTVWPLLPVDKDF